MAAKKKPKKTAVEAKAFFGSMAPRVLSIMRATCAELGGRYAVDVEGQGAWTLDFPTASIAPGNERADVVVRFTPEQFALLSTSRVELKKLVADGIVRCEGDVSRIENISLILAFLDRG